MKLYIVKIEGVRFENPPKLDKTVILVAGEEKMEARDVAIDWFKRNIGPTVVAIDIVGELDIPQDTKVLFALKSAYSPVPTGVTIVIPRG